MNTDPPTKPQFLLPGLFDGAITDEQLAPIFNLIRAIPGVMDVTNHRFSVEELPVVRENYLKNKQEAEAGGWSFPHLWEDPDQPVQQVRVHLHHDFNHEAWDRIIEEAKE